MHAFISSYSGSWGRRLAWLWELKTSLSCGARPHCTPKNINKWMVKINWNNVCIQWPLCSVCVCVVLFPFIFWDGVSHQAQSLPVGSFWSCLPAPMLGVPGTYCHSDHFTWVLGTQTEVLTLGWQLLCQLSPTLSPLLHCFLSTLIFRTQWKAIITSYI